MRRQSLCTFGLVCVHSQCFFPRTLFVKDTYALCRCPSLHRLTFVVLSCPFFLNVYFRCGGRTVDGVVICCCPHRESKRVSLSGQTCACVRADACMCGSQMPPRINPTLNLSTLQSTGERVVPVPRVTACQPVYIQHARSASVT